MDYTQLLMIGRAEWWTQSPSATPLQPIKWNASFWIMFTSDDQPVWLMDSNPICHPSPAKKNEMLTFGLCSHRMISQAGRWTQTPFTTPLQPRKWNACFWIMFPSDDWPGWLMNLNLICHPSPPIKMKFSIYDYVQLLMISQAGQLTQSPSASPLQPIKWNASFWIMFTSDDQPGWLMDSNPICHPLQPEKWNAHFLIMFNFWWSAGLVNWLKVHLPALSSQ